MWLNADYPSPAGRAGLKPPRSATTPAEAEGRFPTHRTGAPSFRSRSWAVPAYDHGLRWSVHQPAPWPGHPDSPRPACAEAGVVRGRWDPGHDEVVTAITAWHSAADHHWSFNPRVEDARPKVDWQVQKVVDILWPSDAALFSAFQVAQGNKRNLHRASLYQYTLWIAIIERDAIDAGQQFNQHWFHAYPQHGLGSSRSAPSMLSNGQARWLHRSINTLRVSGVRYPDIDVGCRERGCP